MRGKDTEKTTSFIVRTDTQLLPFIMKALDGISRTRAKSILTGGGVTVDGKTQVRHDFGLTPGMRVSIGKRKPGAQLESNLVRPVYEDEHIIVIEKRHGILSMATSHHAQCVKKVLDEYFRRSKQRCTAHVVHRLDRDTSGLLVYAKTMQAEQTLEYNWHSIVTDRRYIALVSGALPARQGSVESWLRETRDYITLSSPREGDGKYALTHFKEVRSDGSHTLVELKLATGRKNQIRVHMKDIGHPVCGDTKYGNGDDPIGRLALHAFRLDFYHPVSGEHLHFETPIPKEFTRIFDKMR